MNWETVQGNWDKMKGKVHQKWAKLTDDDLEMIKGKREELAGRLRERYGFEKDPAEKEIDRFTQIRQSILERLAGLADK